MKTIGSHPKRNEQSIKDFESVVSEADEPQACFTEWSKSEREKYCIFFTNIYMESKKKVLMNLFTEKKWRSRWREGLVDTGLGEEDRTNWKSSTAYMSSHV